MIILMSGGKALTEKGIKGAFDTADGEAPEASVRGDVVIRDIGEIVGVIEERVIRN